MYLLYIFNVYYHYWLKVYTFKSSILYTYVSICIYLCIYLLKWHYLSMYIWVCMFGVYRCVCLYVCLYISGCLSMHMHVWVCVCVYIISNYSLVCYPFEKTLTHNYRRNIYKYIEA